MLTGQLRWRSPGRFRVWGHGPITQEWRTWFSGMSWVTIHRSEYMIAEWLTAGGALVLPNTSGPVPAVQTKILFRTEGLRNSKAFKCAEAHSTHSRSRHIFANANTLDVYLHLFRSPEHSRKSPAPSSHIPAPLDQALLSN